MADPIDISIRGDVKAFEKSIDNFVRKQMPYATAVALTAIARRVQTVETEALTTALKKKPTPFTMRAFGVIPATKSSLTAVVFARDIQAQYLEPSEVGGAQSLGTKHALLNPKDIRLNQYGNIPKGTISTLKGRPDIFIGQIQTSRAGLISGVWQRVNVTQKGVDRKRHRQRGSIYNAQHGQLKLLIRWGDGTTISPHLGYRNRAEQIVQQSFQPEMAKAYDKAIATAKAT